MHKAKVAPFLGTLNGQVHLDQPEVNDIILGDLIVGMERQSRFCGQTTQRISVLAHSVEVAREIARELRIDPNNIKSASHDEARLILQGLLHDTSEGLICDIPSPLKHMEGMQGYLRVEQQLMSVIGQRFRIDLSCLPDEVHRADQVMLVREARAYCPSATWAGERQPIGYETCYGKSLKESSTAFCDILLQISEALSNATDWNDDSWRRKLHGEIRSLQSLVESGELG